MEPPSKREIEFSNNAEAVNLRWTHDMIFPEPQGGEQVIFWLKPGVALFGVRVGDWPENVKITIRADERTHG